jgi:cyclase
MPLAHRIIPTFLVKDGMLVKGKRFASDRVVGHALQAIMIQAARGVDEVVLLDVGANARGRGPDLALIEELTDRLFCPLSVGGGIRNLQDIRELLRSGADKVILGTAAWDQAHDLVREASFICGSQAICVSIDVGSVNDYVFMRSGTMPASYLSPARAAEWMVRRGAGEILLQSIERDGMMEGYDLEQIKAVRERVTVPLIASGGCGTYEHMHQALEAGASAVAAGAMFQFTDQTPKGAANYLAAKGVEVRLC